MTAASQRRSTRPVRLTLAASPCDGLDGAWWPRTSSMALELPELIEALRDSLGPVVDIQVNWSSANAVPDLDMLTRRGVAAIPGWKNRPQRVMSLTGERGRANLLVVPSATTSALAMMVLRHAAGLPVDSRHSDSAQSLAACDIVQAARVVCARQVSGAEATPSSSRS
ncbi:DUF5994 family protein [Mycobacterium sp. IS-3022]|uniref:DUF5994 family protein n=1 Tax=Mycobacterium sp. IS-3022 TaxID=1772277 RepID=UPI00257049D7|nr:DUF5994 family protein [Mycobacterium sp. IS-3022]